MRGERAMKIKTLPLSRANVDRSDLLRSDPIALEAMRSQAAFLIFDGEKFAIARQLDSDVNSISLIHHTEPSESRESYFLGRSREDGAQPYFLIRVEPEFLPSDSAEKQNSDVKNSDMKSDSAVKRDSDLKFDSERSTEWRTLREIGAHLSDLEIGLAVHGQGLANWHTKHQRCPMCGAKTIADFGGSIRRCTSDDSEHYPRTDPAIIILLRDNEDRILLGRQRTWPEHRFSTFAGFVETGESFEQAIHREVFEEAGVEVTDIEYLGSQPWPFPASLMIAFQARITNPEAARADETEIEEIRWVSRDSIKSEIDSGTLLLPPLISVARAMIEAWYHEGEQNAGRPSLPGSETWRP